MKRILLAVLMLWSTSAHAEEAAGFKDGVALYEAGKYKDAAAAFEKLIASGQRTEAVYYNLGNAYFRAGQKGKALVSYERALKLDPRDEDARWNVEIVKTALTDRIEGEEEILGMWSRRLLERITADEAAQFLTASILALFALAFLSFLFSRARGFFGALQKLVLIAFAALAVIAGLKWYEASTVRVVVLEKEIFARFGPNLKETKAFLLHEGAQARMLDETNGWVYIVLPNKNSGWIPKEACEKI